MFAIKAPARTDCHRHRSNSDFADRFFSSFMATIKVAIPRASPADASPAEATTPPVTGDDEEVELEETNAKAKADEAARPPVLCISRNKHWRYISSYHGPWLQLPIELLESLLTLNLDPATLAAPEPRSPLYPPTSGGSPTPNAKRNGFHPHNNSTFPDLSPPDSPRISSLSSASITLSASSGNMPPPFPVPEPGKPTPPPIDPGVFRNVTSIRRLIDEAAELSVRASSGLSAAELNMMRSSSSPSMNSSYSNYNSPWASLLPGGGGGGGGGRNVAMSAMRIHRLRALAVQKLAAAYTADEIASSVMVMQGGSVFDDLAERVLKVDPNDLDARYVHFFHEKIPSRQLAESTTTQVLDELIQAQPQKLEYYRTRGIVHCFRDEYSLATKDYTHALKEARAVRKAKVAHHHNYSTPTANGKHNAGAGKGGKKKKGGSGKQRRFADDLDDAGDDPEDTGPDTDEAGGYVPHPSVLPDAPTPLEPQLLFLRGAAYLQHAVHLIESTVLKLEGVHKYSAYSTIGSDGHGAWEWGYLEGGLYGGVEVGNPDGPLGRSTGKKAKAYRCSFRGNGEEEKMREQISGLIKKSMRDHERFLAHFDSLDAGPTFAPGGGDEAWNVAQKVEYAFLLTESIRPWQPGSPASTSSHSHCGRRILLCQIMLGEFTTLLSTFVRTAWAIPAEFIEVLERLAGGWRTGIGAFTMEGENNAGGRGKAKGKAPLAIEAPPLEANPVDDHHPPGSSHSASGSGLSSVSDSNTNDTLLNGSSSSSSSSTSPSPTRAATPVAPSPHAQALNSARILLAPVAARQRAREDERANLKKNGKAGAKKPMSINIPLHGPRVDVILAWLGAVQIPALDRAA
ncbi:hypothetical protein C8R46DRAFT_1109888 [Mycena filopes]|nr:hypothetical protein C8R46DRAFT_1109888 [Mycena filopes]